MSSSDLAREWLALDDEKVTAKDISDKLERIPDDNWVVTACTDRVLDDPALQRTLLELGIKRTDRACERAREAYDHPIGADEEDLSSVDALSDDARRDSLVSHFLTQSTDASLCFLRGVLLERLERLNSYIELRRSLPDYIHDEDVLDEEWEDDPWADDGSETLTKPKRSNPPPAPLLPLSQFLVQGLDEIVHFLASQCYFGAVRHLVERFRPQLWPYRLLILEVIPEYAQPSDYHDILPSFDASANTEERVMSSAVKDVDWSELDVVKAALLDHRIHVPQHYLIPSASSHSNQIASEPLSAHELHQWYERRVDAIVAATGMIDIALSLVQYGASQGVPGLEKVGEELSLMSRLFYDAPRSLEIPTDISDWTLMHWRNMEPPDIIYAYLARSTPSSLPRDIRTLVMPYLFVLEARAERCGQPDPTLPQRMLAEYLLTAPLSLVASVFEASKPTLPAAQRLIRDDEDLTRLALACLYGSNSLDEWSTMSKIFECLPAWDIQATDGDEEDEAEATITALGSFVMPSTTRPQCTASDLLIFFKPLPLTSLSRLLDILDVHLESGETFARWNVPAPLRWFLQSRSDVAEQRKWANRMARRAGAFGERVDTQDQWADLLDDMLKLNNQAEGEVRGAFNLLSREEVIRIFFSGLISSGDFEVARAVLQSSRAKLNLDPTTIEDICLSCSHEFYDNATSGNYKFGEMKLAYDCLDLPSPSERLASEKEFIEATSRISSFNVMSRPGIPITPIEIRLTKDRLSLVSRVLSSNNDAYKHTQVILDLVHKLGFRDDPAAEVKALAMIADTALQAEDFSRAYETSERMVQTLLELRASTPVGVSDSTVEEASEVCWVACFQLGRQPEFSDIEKKMLLLGHALELCPADRLPDILNAWRRQEEQQIEERHNYIASRAEKARPSSIERNQRTSTPISAASIIASRLSELHMPSLPPSPLIGAPDAAAIASKTFSRVAGVASHFPFSVGRRDHSADSKRSGRDGSTDSARRTRPDSSDVTTQASRALQKGMSWLIGTDGE